MRRLGQHILVELSLCNPLLLGDENRIEKIMHQAAIEAGCEVRSSHFSKYGSQGISGIVIISESHLAIHTWPEYRYAAIDIFTCGDRVVPQKACKYIGDKLLAEYVFFTRYDRGLLTSSGTYRHEIALQKDGVILKLPSGTKMLTMDSSIYSAESPFYRIEIYKSDFFGKILFLDGELQSAESDEFIYHEALVQPAMAVHPHPEKVLILGAGEGATIRQVLSHRSVRQVVAVDIDSVVIEACRKYLPEWSQGAFDDPRCRIVYGDAREYLESTQDTFDIIIGDLPEFHRDSRAKKMATVEFYKTVKDHLAAPGVFTVQTGSGDLGQAEVHALLMNTASQVFPVTRSYLAYIPSCFGPWSFIVASNGPDPLDFSSEEIDDRIAGNIAIPLRYYAGETHQRIFSLPKYLRREIESEKRIERDDESFLPSRNPDLP
jgi:spermidine synthase